MTSLDAGQTTLRAIEERLAGSSASPLQHALNVRSELSHMMVSTFAEMTTAQLVEEDAFQREMRSGEKAPADVAHRLQTATSSVVLVLAATRVFRDAVTAQPSVSSTLSEIERLEWAIASAQSSRAKHEAMGMRDSGGRDDIGHLDFHLRAILQRNGVSIARDTGNSAVSSVRVQPVDNRPTRADATRP